MQRLITVLTGLALVLCSCAQPPAPQPQTPGAAPTPPAATEGPVKRHTFVAEGGDFNPDVSADGHLVFVSTRHAEKPDLYVKPVDGKAVTRLTDTPEYGEISPRFSPDARRIALASDRQGNWDLYALPWPEGGALQPLTDTPGTHEIAPDWHPTRPEVLVYSARPIDDQAWEMRLIDTRRGGYTTLGPGLYPRWSADGSKLVFQRARSREPRLYSVWIADVRFDERGNVDMGLPTEIVGGKEWAAVNPVFGPADRVIFASVGRSLEARQGPETLWRGDDLWSIRTDGTDLQRLTTSPAADHEPSWAPALQRVFYTSFRAGSANIWSLPVPGEQP